MHGGQKARDTLTDDGEEMHLHDQSNISLPQPQSEEEEVIKQAETLLKIFGQKAITGANEMLGGA